MKYIAGNTDFTFKNSVVTLGKFDGMHLGHQYLMEQVLSYKKQGYTAVMFSFLYHPGNLFSDKEVELIYTEEEKVRLLEKMDFDVLIAYPFTEATRSMEPEDFIKQILVDQLDSKVIVVGSDFRFGRKRRGDTNLLKEYAEKYQYQVIVCEKRTWNHRIISSSTIRQELAQGNMEIVNGMLGKPYSIQGEVLHGRRIGRTLGIPTTNILPPTNKLLPPCGVYASITRIDGMAHYGITNIGHKPTVGNDEQLGVETFLFDYDQELYGKVIEVELYHFQRPEMKFNSLEELQQKMRSDIEETKYYFKKDASAASI